MFGADLDAVGVRRARARAQARVAGLRDVAPRLAQADGGLLAAAVALLHWHREHPRCARCGAATAMGEAGWVRACPACGATQLPAHGPGGHHAGGRRRPRAARAPGTLAGRWSALAGFVEPGESLEEAVAREVTEEAGVAVGDVVYRSSQPWPFPASLMLGFTARYTGGEAHARDGELEALGWFDRDELVGMLRRLLRRLDGDRPAPGRRVAGRGPDACDLAAPGLFAVGRLPAHADVPAWVPGDGFVAVTRTRAELSIVCAREAVPADVRALGGYAALEVAGPPARPRRGARPAHGRAGPCPDPGVFVDPRHRRPARARAPDLARAQAALDG